MKKKPWTDYFWIFTLLYFILGFFNILFAWLGLICLATPIIISISKGTKAYCNRYCGRGKLLQLLGDKLKLSRNRDIPAFMRSKAFRYGFLTFFMIMFSSMIISTYFVYTQTRELSEVVTLLWTFKVPWHWAYDSTVTPWVAQFAFGFYSVMSTSTILGLVTMVLYKPRAWCVYCPVGTMTQGICQRKQKDS